MTQFKSLFIFLLNTFLIFVGCNSFAKSDTPYERKLERLLEQTRFQNCSNPSDELATVLCLKKIRIGVRNNYPGFGESKNGQFDGFEIKIAQIISNRLGVVVEWVPVSAANRIEKLINREVDVVLATMAHTTTRDQVIHFVRPHYYSSPTSIVGAAKIKVSDWSDLVGRSVCVPLGNFSNMLFSEHQVRMMIYDRPDRMVEAFNLGACNLIAHDQSFVFGSLLKNTNDRSGGNALEEKFSFNNVPWGIGVRKTASKNLGHAIALMVADMHQSGQFIELADQSGIKKAFLEKQQLIWNTPNCFDALDTSVTSGCFLPAVHLADHPSSIEDSISSFEMWLDKAFDLKVRFPDVQWA